MGERPSIEAKWNSLSVDILLPYTSHNLRDVDRTSLGPRGHHLSESVVLSQVLKGTSSGLIQSFSERIIDLYLEGSLNTETWKSFKFASLSFLDDSLDLFLLLGNNFADLKDCFWRGYDILNSHSHTVPYKPVVDQVLRVRHEDFALLWSEILPDNMDKTSRSCSNYLFVYEP